MVMVEFAAYDTHDTGLALKPAGNVKEEHRLSQPPVAMEAGGVGVELDDPIERVMVVELAFDDKVAIDELFDKDAAPDDVDGKALPDGVDSSDSLRVGVSLVFTVDLAVVELNEADLLSLFDVVKWDEDEAANVMLEEVKSV